MYEPSYTSNYSPEDAHPDRPLLIVGYFLTGLTLLFTIIGVIMGVKLYIKHKARKALIEEGYKDLFLLKTPLNKDQQVVAIKKENDTSNIMSLLGPKSAFLSSVEEALKSDPNTASNPWPQL